MSDQCEGDGTALSCFSGGIACLWPWKFVPYLFDAVSPISLDGIANAIHETLSEYRDNPEQFFDDVAEFGKDFLKEDFRSCYRGLAGEMPTCSRLATFHSCMTSLRSALLGSQKKAVKALKTFKTFDKLLSNVQPEVKELCRINCGNEDCTEGELTNPKFKEPEGCKYLQEDISDAKNRTVRTPDQCARNSHEVVAKTAGETPKKIQFTFMGCYVGNKKPDGCDVAQPADEIPGHYFIACLDQYGRDLNLESLEFGKPKSSKIWITYALVAAGAAVTLALLGWMIWKKCID